MKTFIKQITIVWSIVAIAFFAGCSDDIDPLVTSLDTDRLFSPINFSVKITNKTSATLSWTAVNGAQNYNIEFYANGNQDYSGTPVKTISGITYTQVPYTVSGFDGETAYSARVQAMGSDIDNSKWTSITFKTDAEQIFLPVAQDDIQATQVTLRWTAGEAATQIVLTPGDIKHDVTSEEIENGAATVTGLTGETTYTAVLMKDTKVRGTVSFTTKIDLGGAIPVYPEDDLTAMITEAVDGDVFAIFPGTYNLQDITVSASIGIKGTDPADKPILKGVILRIKAGAAITLKDLVLDGTGAKDNNQTVIYDADGSYGAFKMEDCEIKNYVKGTFYVNTKALIESVTIKGCIYSNIECSGGDFIDFRTGVAKKFEYTNNTAYNSALARDFFRMDNSSTNFSALTSTINISNNTFNNVSIGTGNRMLYIRFVSNEITFDKNIIANTQGYYTNQASTTIKEMKQNDYWNAPNFTGSTTANAKNDTDPSRTNLDPGFKNASAGDFTVSNETLKEDGIGDPRWLQ